MPDQEAFGSQIFMLDTSSLFLKITAGTRKASVLIRTDNNGSITFPFLERNNLSYLVRYILRLILIHLDDGICLTEKCAGAACYQNSADTGLLIECTHSVRKWCDRFLFFRDDFLHQRIPHHKIRCAGVLVHQQCL